MALERLESMDDNLAFLIGCLCALLAILMFADLQFRFPDVPFTVFQVAFRIFGPLIFFICGMKAIQMNKDIREQREESTGGQEHEG